MLTRSKFLNKTSVAVRFTVHGNNNIYFATSHRSKTAFCKENDFKLDREFDVQSVSISDRNTAVHCGRGIYFIEANINGIV